MLLFNDESTRNLETNGNWVDCVEYLYCKWKNTKNNVPLLLKLSTTAWFTLTLDGTELSLTKIEYQHLCEVLFETYSFFVAYIKQDENCQWLFGYMMIVRPDLFLKFGLDYIAIEQQGITLIETSGRNGNMFAQLLYAEEKYSKKDIKKCRQKIKEHISEYFDKSQETDNYFIEVLTKEVR